MLTAHQVWGCDTDKYLMAAKKAGEVTWQRGLLKKGPGLCHGVSGNGYAFLHLYQVSKSKHSFFSTFNKCPGDWRRDVAVQSSNVRPVVDRISETGSEHS